MKTMTFTWFTVTLAMLGCNKREENKAATTEVTFAEMRSVVPAFDSHQSTPYDAAIAKASAKLGAPQDTASDHATWWSSNGKNCGRLKIEKNSDGTAAFGFSSTTMSGGSCGPSR